MLKNMKCVFYLIASLVVLDCFGQFNNEKMSIFNNEGVELNLIKTNCIDKVKGIEKQLLIIDVTNENDYPILLTFKKELWYDNVCTSCNSLENIETLKIESKSSISGGCYTEQKTLNVFVKMLNLKDVRQLTKYEFKDIRIEKAN